MKISVIKPSHIGTTAYCAAKLLIKTLNVKVVRHPLCDPSQQYVHGFWHDKHFIPIMMITKYSQHRYAGLVSVSRDGEILATWLKHLGYEIIRGSSSRHAISSFLKLLDALKQGYAVGIAADGPRGPRYEAKSGLSFLAYKSGLPFVPIGVASSSRWCFERSWDKYQLPKPFSKNVFYFGEPIWIENLDDQQQVNQRIADAIIKADQTAQRILEGESVEALQCPEIA